jgi:hypothetical protein
MKPDPRAQDEALRVRLEDDRATWDSHWRDLANHFAPRNPRFLTTDRNQGGGKNGKMLTGHPARALRTLASGMMTSITSPARPWFILELADQALMERQDVRDWLSESTEVLRDIFAGSNFYKAMPSLFMDLGLFGVHAMHVDEDPEEVIRCYNFPIGSYSCSSNARGVVDTVVRKFSMTTRQLVEKFGIDKVSDSVKKCYESHRYEDWHDDVVHLLKPNPDYDPKRLGGEFKKYISKWYMISDTKKYLSISGYDEFPTMAPRWDVIGEDAYGSSPAMLALPDCKSLMVYEKRIAQAIEKKVNPPTVGPTDMKNAGIDTTPGAQNFAAAGSIEKVRSIYDGNAFQIAEAAAKAQGLKSEIEQTMFVDLFLMLINSDRRQVTAEEIRAKQEEKILAIGSVLERMNDELLNPVIDRTFAIAYRQGRIPQPPREIQGVGINVKYVSVMHQVQRMVALGGIDRLVAFLSNVAGAYPQVLDKFDADQAIDEVAQSLGTPSKLVRSDDAVAEIRAARAAQQAQQANMQMAALQVDAAKTLSQTDTGGTNALTDLMRQQSSAI